MGRYVTDFNFGWDKSDFVSSETGKATSEQLAEANLIWNFLQQRFIAFSYFVSNSLRERKLALGRPPIAVLGFRLSRSPAPNPEILVKRSIWTDIAYDPRQLLDVPEDSVTIGELGISFVSATVKKLRAMPPFPVGDMQDVCDVIEEACEAFRAADYTWHRHLVTRDVPSSKLKGRIDVYMDGVRSWRTFALLHRGKELLSTAAGETGAGAWYHIAQFNRFERDGDRIIFHSLDDVSFDIQKSRKDWVIDPLYFPFEINLRDFPDAYAYIIEKDLLDDGPVI